MGKIQYLQATPMFLHPYFNYLPIFLVAGPHFFTLHALQWVRKVAYQLCINSKLHTVSQESEQVPQQQLTHQIIFVLPFGEYWNVLYKHQDVLFKECATIEFPQCPGSTRFPNRKSMYQPTGPMTTDKYNIDLILKESQKFSFFQLFTKNKFNQLKEITILH